MSGARRLVLSVLAALPAAVSAGEGPSRYGPAYLAYAGPYSSSPSSAFGHLFLVLAATPDEPAPLWDVVTFNAVTFGADPVRYLTIGILGGFPGRFSRLEFHQKSREYELLDDRDLWLVRLELTDAQRARVEQALADASGRWLPYTFFQRNCAHHLQRLLAEATGAVPAPSGLVSPTGVMAAVLATPLAGPTYHRPAASRRIAALAAGVEPGVTARLARDDWLAVAADTAWIERLGPSGRRLAQEYFGLRTLEATSTLPPATLAGLARLRVLNADAPERPGPALDAGPGLPIPPAPFHRYSRLRLSYVAAESGPDRLSLGVRGALHDGADPSYGHQPIDAMELLSLEVSTRAGRPEPALESAVLFSQRALAASTWIRPRRSWLLELLARRGGLFDRGVHLEARGGLGATFRLRGEVYAHGLATLAAVGRWDHGAALAPGVEAGLVALPFERWRLGARWSREHDAFEWSRSHQRIRAWTRLDLSRRWGLTLAAGRDGDEATAAAGLDWYP